MKTRRERTKRKIRYAVVGLGYISQIAVLPAFAHAKSNSTLTALISGDQRIVARPTLVQEIAKPAVTKPPRLVKAQPPAA